MTGSLRMVVGGGRLVVIRLIGILEVVRLSLGDANRVVAERVDKGTAAQ